MRKCALFLLGLTRWASCRQVQPASSNYATTPTCSRLHLPRAIHACVKVAFSVIGSVSRRFAWNSRYSKLIDIRSEDFLSPLGEGVMLRHVGLRALSLCSQSSIGVSLIHQVHAQDDHWQVKQMSGPFSRCCVSLLPSSKPGPRTAKRPGSGWQNQDESYRNVGAGYMRSVCATSLFRLF